MTIMTTRMTTRMRRKMTMRMRRKMTTTRGKRMTRKGRMIPRKKAARKTRATIRTLLKKTYYHCGQGRGPVWPKFHGKPLYCSLSA